MNKKIKKILISLAVSTIIVTESMGTYSANAASTYTIGDPGYGSCYYYLSNDNGIHLGEVTSYSSSTRYTTLKIYIATSVNATPLPGTTETGSSNLVYNTTLNVHKTQTASGYYKYFYKAELYGNEQGPYVPIVETKYLNLSA